MSVLASSLLLMMMLLFLIFLVLLAFSDLICFIILLCVVVIFSLVVRSVLSFVKPRFCFLCEPMVTSRWPGRCWSLQKRTDKVRKLATYARAFAHRKLQSGRPTKARAHQRVRPQKQCPACQPADPQTRSGSYANASRDKDRIRRIAAGRTLPVFQALLHTSLFQTEVAEPEA
jgi:hypothetical protein